MSIEITWDKNRCSHSGVCVRSLPAVFRIHEGQFVIKPAGASEPDVRRIVAACPSGALTAR
jgi:uncharacterized Fe-S cluster protein YjdI